MKIARAPVCVLTLATLLAATAGAPWARAQSPQPAPDAPPASGDAPKPEAEAQQRFQRAQQLYHEGDFALALVEFRRAYELSPNYRVLYNIGQVNIQLFNYAAARVALEKYLQDGGTDVPENRRAQVASDLKMLRDRTAYLQIVTKPAGADIAIDDIPMGKSPFDEPLLVNAGQRKVVVNKVGHLPATRFVTLGGGDRNDLTIELTPVPTESAKPVIVTVPHETKANYTPAVIGWIGSGTLAVATAIVGGLYLSKEAEIRKLSEPAQTIDRQDALDTESSATRLAVAADILGVAAIAAGGVALYFTLRPPRTDLRTPTGSIRPTPTGLVGTF